MTATSNYITDLLDGIDDAKSCSVIIVAGETPQYFQEPWNYFDAKDPELHDVDELRTDLEALGFELKSYPVKYFYRYDPSGKEDEKSRYFNVVTGYITGAYRVQFRYMQDPENFKRLMTMENPITKKEYEELAY